MEYITKGDLKLSRLCLGNMRTGWTTNEEGVEELIDKALELGINFFDHADIYGAGKSEELFGAYLKKYPEKRKDMIIQTKCAIIPGKMYDSSKEHILKSVDAAIERLNCGYLDILLLHRPDALCDYQEVAETFDELYKSGKVKHFGVSNYSTSQIKLLKKYCKQEIEFNQLQFSVAHCPSIDAGFHVNMKDEYASDMCGENVFDYCARKDITVQTWSSLQVNFQEGSFINNPNYPKLNEVLDRLAGKYGVSKHAISIAWVLRLPQKMIPVLGTTKAKNLEDLADSLKVNLTREEWYELYLSLEKPLP